MYFEQGEVITRMQRNRATEFVTSEEITFHNVYGAFFSITDRNRHCFGSLNQNYSK